MAPGEMLDSDLEPSPVFMYAVVYREGEIPDAQTYSPFIYQPQSEDDAVTVPHGLSRAAAAALPGLWYCLHLPNNIHQLSDIPAALLKLGQQLNLSHQIMFVPIEIFDQAHCANFMAGLESVLAVCPDDLLEECHRRAGELGFSLPSIGYSEISDETLGRHWREVHRLYASGVDYIGREVKLTRRLDLAALELPRRWLARQMTWDSTERQADSLSDLNNLTLQTLHQQALLSAFAKMEREQVSPDQVEVQLPRAYAEAEMRIPVTLALPGVAPAYSRFAYESRLRARAEEIVPLHPEDSWSTDIHTRSDSMVERAAIEFIATHNSLGESGIGFVLPSVPPEAFVVLAEIERHFSGAESARSVWRLLDRLNEAASPLWSDPLIQILKRAGRLTAFTNFPIGLLRIPGDSAPLAMRLPIAYRPLTPLLRSIQDELRPSYAVELNRGTRVLVAECIPSSDQVGRLSRIGWSSSQEIVGNEASGITMDIVETLSLDQLRRAVDDHAPHILVISAHGTLDGNSAGLVIGDEVCVQLGLERPPPVVILSACNAAPRGTGAVSVTDLLLREGAMAVLGTQMPVDVRRNAVLMGRFFVNIAEAFQRVDEHPTLLEIWRHVQASNVVNDVIGAGSKSLTAWGHSRAPSGESVIAEFMLRRSRGRLRTQHIYTDTEEVLGEIADDQGLGDRVRNWFRRPGYVPESLFYLFAGRPDRIYVSNLNARVVGA
ncbi:CHAT domain-containing protein [Streptomyces sp. BH104]|uniref:CHAT domain-containing protein n=1 Tax=Streptomyces sp. BH104 TaxID=3410407 RepID=UPI003BB73368